MQEVFILNRWLNKTPLLLQGNNYNNIILKFIRLQSSILSHKQKP